MTSNSDATNHLLKQAARGDPRALGALLTRHGDRLRRMAALRMDRRLQGRIDASDVIQEAYLEASARLTEYLGDPSVPFFLWLQFLTGQKLVTLHRHHLGVQMRAAGQEVALCREFLPEASSAALAAQLLGHDTRPSEAAVRADFPAGPLSSTDLTAGLRRFASSIQVIDRIGVLFRPSVEQVQEFDEPLPQRCH
jgi:RNA polymerase sigma-70 factor, ECF subfamily